MADITTVGGLIQRLGFADILLWLLTFAVVYGIMSQAIPKLRKETSAIIAIVIGFFVIMAAPVALITFLSKLSSYLVLMVLGLLVLIIFFEAAGVHREIPIIKEGKYAGVEKKPFLSHSMAVVAIVVVAILLFVGAGGLDLIGFKLPYGFDILGVVFLAAIIGAVLWMIQEKK